MAWNVVAAKETERTDSSKTRHEPILRGNNCLGRNFSRFFDTIVDVNLSQVANARVKISSVITFNFDLVAKIVSAICEFINTGRVSSGQKSTVCKLLL